MIHTISNTTRISIAYSDLMFFIKKECNVDLPNKPEKVTIDPDHFRIDIEWTKHETIPIKSNY